MLRMVLVLAWLLVALLGHHLTTARSNKLADPTPRSTRDTDDPTTTPPCVGQEVLEKQNAMEKTLNSMQQKLLDISKSSVGVGSTKELMELKNKVLDLEAKLGLAENQLQASQSKVKADETQLEVSAIKNRFLAMESKLEAAESKLEAAQAILKDVKSKLDVAESKMEAAESKLKVAESKLEGTATALQAIQTSSKRKGASTFVRWGRKGCTNTTELVYSGVVGGSHYSYYGAAADAQCLTLDPQFDTTPVPSSYTWIYGAEYETIPGHHNHDVPCAVCRTLHPTTLMIPSTQACPLGWTVQYKGRLASGHYSHKAASEHICLDENLEDSRSGHQNHDGKLFYYIAYSCGSLPCPPYVYKKIVLCVVCSK